MKQSHLNYTYEACKTGQQQYSIGVRVDPSMNNVESFAVILFFQQRDGTRVEVVKVDDSPHEEGDVHVDRYYRELGAEVKDFDAEIDDHLDAEEYIREGAPRFARLYEEHHGTGVRADGKNT